MGKDPKPFDLLYWNSDQTRMPRALHLFYLREFYQKNLLAKGEITAKIDIEVAGASASAREAVEKAGGSVTTTFTKKVYSNKKGEPGKRQKRRADSAAKRAARKA